MEEVDAVVTLCLSACTLLKTCCFYLCTYVAGRTRWVFFLASLLFASLVYIHISFDSPALRPERQVVFLVSIK